MFPDHCCSAKAASPSEEKREKNTLKLQGCCFTVNEPWPACGGVWCVFLCE